MVDFSRAARKIAKECPVQRVREASRLLSRVYDEALRPLGIQGSQLSVLVAVAMFGERGAMIGALAQALVLDRTTLTRNVQPLEKAGLLRVARSPEDARARVVVLTRAGERTIESAYPLWEQAQERLRDSLGAGRVDALRDQLAEVIAFAPRLDDVEPQR
jgi:DNA-binding MarR family transcriptional regulator